MWQQRGPSDAYIRGNGFGIGERRFALWVFLESNINSLLQREGSWSLCLLRESWKWEIQCKD